MAARKKPIEVIKPAIDSIAVPIYSQSRLVVNGWGAKGPSILMGDPEAGVKPRAPRNPEAAFLNALHALDKKSPPKRTGFPACGFKKAMVRASKNMEGMSMKDSNSMIFVIGEQFGDEELVEIFGKYQMRTDIVRLKNGSADVRFRPEYPVWSAIVPIQFDSSMISRKQVINLLDRAGTFVGIGENRPEKGGTWGRFTVLKPKGWKGPNPR